MKVLWQCPPDAIAAVVLAHGAGAGMSHPNMQSIADAFEGRGIATLRLIFPSWKPAKAEPIHPRLCRHRRVSRHRRPVQTHPEHGVFPLRHDVKSVR